MALINKQIVWHVKRKSMRNIYIDTYELEDLLNNLKPTEIKLYNHLMGLPIRNPTVSSFDTTQLAFALGCSAGTIKNSRATLTKLGYLIIRKFKDESGDDMVRVVIGKDQVELYNLGLKVEISEAKAYKELTTKFGFLDKTKTVEERTQLVEQANQYYKEHMC